MSLFDEQDGWKDEADDRKEPRLEDTGTMFDHLSYLQSLWGETLRMLSRRNPKSLSLNEQKAIRDLEGAVHLIERQMEVMSGYGTKKWDLGRDLDSIPKADQITGGRGTGPKKIRGFFG